MARSATAILALCLWRYTGASAALDKVPYPTTLDEAFAVVEEHISALEAGRMSPEEAAGTCTITDDEPCSFADMPKDETTLVYPGGDSRCITTTTTPYAFQVIPGDADKIMFYFQGGGACWDRLSTEGPVMTCTTGAYADYQLGWFDRKLPSNPWKDYTVVNMLYCSGDAFVANNKTQSYNTHYGDPAVQTGQQNVMATLDWVKSQFTTTPLSSVVVSGYSAGALGAQAWSHPILQTFPSEHAVILPDSYLGVFPNGTQGNVLKNIWPVCDDFRYNPLQQWLTPELLKMCKEEELTLQDWIDEVIVTNPTVPFAYIQSKYDVVQTAFYSLIAASMFKGPLVLPPAKFYAEAEKIFLRYDVAPNTVHYFVECAMHTYTQLPIFWTATTTGIDGLKGPTNTTMHEWASRLLERPAVGTTECFGALEDEDSWGGVGYCDSQMAGKVFTGLL